MTGEMFKEDVTREAFPLHFAIADALNGHVEPFDVYQGPYICIGQDMRAGSEPYQIAIQNFGVIRLWLIRTVDGDLIYNEANDKRSTPFPFDDTECAIEAAQSIL